MIRFPSLRSRLAPFIALAALVGSVLALDAQAASLQISPVSINLRANQAASGINLQNLGERPVYGQVRVFAWDQRNGEDVLTPTDELVASPPIIEVGAKGSQTIRLVRKGGAAGNAERTYRLLIDEIPREDEQASAWRSACSTRCRCSWPRATRRPPRTWPGTCCARTTPGCCG